MFAPARIGKGGHRISRDPSIHQPVRIARARRAAGELAARRLLDPPGGTSSTQRSARPVRASPRRGWPRAAPQAPPRPSRASPRPPPRPRCRAPRSARRRPPRSPRARPATRLIARLDVVRRVLLAADHDQVLVARDEEEVAVADVAAVAGIEPAVDEHRPVSSGRGGSRRRASRCAARSLPTCAAEARGPRRRGSRPRSPAGSVRSRPTPCRPCSAGLRHAAVASIAAVDVLDSRRRRRSGARSRS